MITTFLLSLAVLFTVFHYTQSIHFALAAWVVVGLLVFLLSVNDIVGGK